MSVERKEFRSLKINIETERYLLNGEEMNGVSRINLEFDNGGWVLLVTKDELYVSQATPGGTTE